MYNYTIEQVGAGKGDSLMLLVSCADYPEHLFAYDDVNVVEVDGALKVEFQLQVLTNKDNKLEIAQEEFTRVGEHIIRDVLEKFLTAAAQGSNNAEQV